LLVGGRSIFGRGIPLPPPLTLQAFLNCAVYSCGDRGAEYAHRNGNSLMMLRMVYGALVGVCSKDTQQQEMKWKAHKQCGCDLLKSEMKLESKMKG
jgi:hypothetical protein